MFVVQRMLHRPVSNHPRDAVRKGTRRLTEKISIHVNGMHFVLDGILGNGSFGVVFMAVCRHTPDNEVVAIKKVLQDKRFKVRVN